MSNPFRKLPSDATPFQMSRTAYNQMIDMLNWWKGSAFRTGAGRQNNLFDFDQSVFLIKNGSGSDFGTSYGVLGIDGPLYTPTENETEFKNLTPLTGVEPSVASHAGGKWCVLLEPVANEKIGRACLAGVVPVRVYVNGAADEFIDVIAAETVGGETTYLGTGASGAKIIWLEDDTEETIVWALVHLSSGSGGIGNEMCIGILDASLEQGGSATVSVWEGGEDTGDNITAYDWLMKEGTEDIAAGKKVICAKINDTWYVVDAECP